MRSEALDTYACPGCGGRTWNVADPDNGELVCGGCGASYAIRQGIPRFVEPENYAASFGFQWNQHARTQLDSFTGRPVSRDRLFGVTGWPEDLRGQKILEAGSGAGRFTEVLASTGGEIHSFDYSLAVEANNANNGDKGNVHLFQGNIFRMPFVPGGFDKVMCLGVIQHTPDPERAFRCLAAQVKPGGELAIDVYASRLSAWLHWRWLLRPVTRRMDKQRLYRIVSAVTPVLLPVAVFLRRLAGRYGARLIPVVEFSDLHLPKDLHVQWAILDTFDWYSPAFDFPQSKATVERWFAAAGFEDVSVGYGPNGVVGRGRRPR
ncbi:MAG: methyltransferase domain-containing protein [Gammaproteobacteria bacterium]|nr:methyltransferase domain-containing protein [Gammaproteobacteria bacterium]MBU1972422.1 methyltransferase domain-containing protein [Gammaproteobacteria bacterium]